MAFKRYAGRALGSVFGGPIGYAAGAAYDKKNQATPGNPRNEVRDQYGNLLYGQPDVGIDPETGMPRDLPTGKQGPAVQHAADIWTRRFNLQRGEASQGTYANALRSITSGRQGSAAALTSGLFQGAAQTELARRMDSPYLLYWSDRDAQAKAKDAARKAGYAQIAGQVIGTGIGLAATAASGGAAAPMIPALAGLGGAAGNYFLGSGATPTTMNFLQDTKQGYQQSPATGGQTAMDVGGVVGGATGGAMGGGMPVYGAGLRAGAGGPGGPRPGPGGGPAAPGMPQPGGGPAAPQHGGQGGPGGPGGPQQQGGPGAPQGGAGAPMGAPGAGAPMSLTPSFPKTEMRFGIPSPRVSVAVMELDPTLDPTRWLDSLDDELTAMIAEDMIESPFAGVIT